MQLLHIDQRLTSISTGGPNRQMKQIICHHCGKPIRFLISLPNICNKCMYVVAYPDHLFAKVSDRLDYYKEGR